MFRRYRVNMVLGLLVLAISILISCSNDNAPPANAGKETPKTATSKVDWADMLLGPGDTTQYAWVGKMQAWPDTLYIPMDSASRGQLEDLTFAFATWIFKDVAMDSVPNLNGCRISTIIAARHIPDYQLIKEFRIDSVVVFEPGQDIPAGRRPLFPAARKFLQTVWQVEFLTAEEDYQKLDFPEGTLLQPRAYASWRGKTLIFDLPPQKYEYLTEQSQ